MVSRAAGGRKNRTQQTKTVPPVVADKVLYASQSSLAFKMNVTWMARRLVLLLQLNLLFFSFGSILLLALAEQTVAGAYSDWQQTGVMVTTTCRIEMVSEWQGVKVIAPLRYWLPETTASGHRRLAWGSDGNLKDRLDAATYTVVMNPNEELLSIHYALGNNLSFIYKFLPYVLVIQLLIWLAGFFPGRRDAREVLRPLAEMTLEAQTLSRLLHHQGPISGSDMDKIEALAGAINRIDTGRLDSQLKVDNRELSGLAEAINAMLSRIHQSYRQQSQFVSDASHELRTPIAVIQGYINMLDRWGKEDQQTLQESIDAIKSESAHMKDLVEQLLFLARGDNDTMVLDWQVLNMTALMSEIFREAQLIDPGHIWVFTGPGAEPLLRSEPTCDETNDPNGAETGTALAPLYVRADEGLIKQSIRILADNAIKYTPVGGEILLSIRSRDNSVLITVQDQGIGIAAEDLPRIFDRFFRSEASRARSTGGTGLGLAIAKWIVDRHGGHFEILSRTALGTRIEIHLPQVEEPGV